MLELASLAAGEERAQAQGVLARACRLNEIVDGGGSQLRPRLTDSASPTTDHSREYVLIVTYRLAGKRSINLGVRDTLADMGQTIAENFDSTIPHGKSFLPLFFMD